MTLPRRLWLAVFFLAGICCSAQVQPCIDVRTVSPNRNAAQGVYDFNNKWTPGTTIRVSFLDGTEWQKARVRQYAVLWSKYANVKFDFMKLGTGDVRVSFDKPGSWSFIGTDCKNRSSSQETMNLGWINETKTDGQLKSVILHEFGHALGLLHEHMNPLSNIKWNKLVVYAWYLQYEGWDKEMVDKQVFDRYSVNMTNKSYDPKSVMHYSVPANFTVDGYAVGENYDLSENDKKLIADLYPKNKTFKTDNRTAKWSKLEDLRIEYDVTENGRLGMRVSQDFLIYNSEGNKCIMAVYFYDADNSKPLEDRNGKKASANGNVAAYVYFNPQYQSTQYKDLSVFMPYEELELGDGSFRLKCYVALFDTDLRVISSSGYQYFTFSQGLNTPEIKASAQFNQGTAEIEVIPAFTLNNAIGLQCHVAVLFFDEKGMPIQSDASKYIRTEGIVGTTTTFVATTNPEVFANTERLIKLKLPVSELSGRTNSNIVQCKVVLYSADWKRVQSSEFIKVQYTAK